MSLSINSKNKVLRCSFSKGKAILMMGSIHRTSYALSLYCQILPCWLWTGIQKLKVLICFLQNLPLFAHFWQTSHQTHQTEHMVLYPKHNGAGHFRIWTRSTWHSTPMQHIIFFCHFPTPCSNMVERDRDTDWKTTSESIASNVHKNLGDKCRYFQNKVCLKFKNKS